LAAVDVRLLASLEEIAAAQHLIRAVWRAPDREAIPNEVLRAMTARGNPLLGGFVEGRLAGICFGFWGRDPDGTLWLYSSRLGLLEQHRGSGLAEELKRAQARFAADRDVGEIRWTFDPMRAANAAFNLHKLGASSNRFIEDLLGTRSDALNIGERTDRLLAVWRPTEARRALTGDVRRVRIPADPFALPPAARAAARDLARDELRSHFEAGYAAVDFEPPGEYVLVR
jgi:predicted GNAT superfamily acetyltransferase